jgi:hypothetical protein
LHGLIDVAQKEVSLRKTIRCTYETGKCYIPGGPPVEGHLKQRSQKAAAISIDAHCINIKLWPVLTRENAACRMMHTGMKKMAYSGVVLLHVVAWIVALAGLASTHSSCEDMDSFPIRDALFAPEQIELDIDCKKVFRCA